MFDRGRILIGLVVFFAVVLFPVWFNALAGRPSDRPELEMPTGTAGCVAPAEEMRGNHMELLREWRDSVVRDGERDFLIETEDGGPPRVVKKSLTGTCLQCHGSRDRFCNRCHDYLGVQPNCFDCHHDGVDES